MKRLFVWLASVSICAAQAVSIGPFATESWVEERIQTTTNGLAAVSYVDSAVGEVEDKIPDVSGLATKEYVDAVSNAIPDVSTFSTVEYVNTTSNNLALLMDDLVSEEELGSSVSNIVPGWALVPVPPVTAEVDPAFTNWLATTNSATVQYVDSHKWDWSTQITNPPDFATSVEVTNIVDAAVSNRLNSSTMAEVYDPAKTYFAGDYATYNGNLYKCLAENTGTFDTNKWQTIQLYKNKLYDAEVEWVALGGSVYIDTGITNATIGFKTTMKATSNLNNGFGEKYFSGSESSAYFSCPYGSGSWASISRGGPSSSGHAVACVSKESAMADFHEYELASSGIVYCDGDQKGDLSSKTQSSGTVFYVGAVSKSGGLYSGQNAKYKETVIYINGVAVRDFIPVRKGQVGYYYDKVEGKLYLPVSGVLSFGPDKAPKLPSMDGVASAGTDDEYARFDHVHPSDTSKADKSYVDSHQWDWETQITNAPAFVESEVDPAFTNWLATTNSATVQYVDAHKWDWGTQVTNAPGFVKKSGDIMTGNLTMYEPQNGATIYFPSESKGKLSFGSMLFEVDDATRRVTIRGNDVATVEDLAGFITTEADPVFNEWTNSAVLVAGAGAMSVNGSTSTAIGSNVKTYSFCTLAVGNDVVASNQFAVAVGVYDTKALAPYATAVGPYNTASGESSTAVGMWTTASDDFSTSVGYHVTSHGPGTFNINPTGGAAGVWIGETNLATYLAGGGGPITEYDPKWTQFKDTHRIWSKTGTTPGGSTITNTVVYGALAVSQQADLGALNALGFANGVVSIESGGIYSTVLGLNAVSSNSFAFVYSGRGDTKYADHGTGTFNIDPIGGIEGFWIGETNLATYLQNAGAGITSDKLYNDSVTLALGTNGVVTVTPNYYMSSDTQMGNVYTKIVLEVPAEELPQSQGDIGTSMTFLRNKTENLADCYGYILSGVLHITNVVAHAPATDIPPIAKSYEVGVMVVSDGTVDGFYLADSDEVVATFPITPVKTLATEDYGVISLNNQSGRMHAMLLGTDSTLSMSNTNATGILVATITFSQGNNSLVVYEAGDQIAPDEPTLPDMYDIRVPANLSEYTNDAGFISSDVIAPGWQQGSYTNGDFVIYNAHLYECTNATSGVWAPADWKQTSVTEILGNLRKILDAINGEAL